MAAHLRRIPSPDERRARLGRGALDEEPPAPGADLDLHPVAGDDGAKLDAVALGQAGSVVVGAGHREGPKR